MSEHTRYAALDQPGVLEYLFHPRPTSPGRREGEERRDMMIPVAEGASLGASFHIKDPNAPVLLFFHGNGEIVQDYDELGQAFTRWAGVNFFVVDYRGYGDSSGRPSVSSMMADAHRVLAFVKEEMVSRQMAGPLSVMGRSLGSAPALELASACGGEFFSLIIESGFAFAGPLLRVLGLDPDLLGFREENGMGNLEKMGKAYCPCLVIHAASDMLIPFSDGQALFDACPSHRKELLKIEGAGHNDIFIRGMGPYLEGVKRFCSAAG
ncbi:MAG: alpha/beta hydrolase [Desulfobacter sp.]|nr:MAG: alpha/beta hydrolase [Desulfobacter sp.]